MSTNHKAEGRGTVRSPRIRASDGARMVSTTVHIPQRLHALVRQYAFDNNLKHSEVYEKALWSFLP